MDYSDIFLWGLEENHKARRFYEKMGFVFSGNSMETQIGGKKLREVQYTYQTPSHTIPLPYQK